MTNSPSRFALIGKSGSGKSEVARIIQRYTGGQIIKTGHVCRTIARILFGNDHKRSTQLIDDALTPLDSSIFLRAALRGVDLKISFVIDSLRFKTDLEIARDLNCHTVRVVAEDETRVHRLANRKQQFDLENDGAHRSETELDSVPTELTITNHGTLAELEADVLRATSLHR